VTAFGTEPDGISGDPIAAAATPLADLAAMLRGGGQLGADPAVLSRQFADSLALIAAHRAVVLSVEHDGLFLDGQALWTDDMLARRASTALLAQGLSSVTVASDATQRAVATLAVLLARDWGSADIGALRRTVASGASPGLIFNFEQDAQAAEARQILPTELLSLLRSPAGKAADDVTRALDLIRQHLERPGDVVGAILGAGLDKRQRLGPELTAIDDDVDISADVVGRVLFECMRLDPSGLQAADTFRLALDHFDSLASRGRAQEADALIRRAIALANEETGPNWPHRALLQAEVDAIFNRGVILRLVGAANAAAEGTHDSWVRLLFGLGSAIRAEQVAGATEIFGELSNAAHRQAVADGLVLALHQDLDSLDSLLSRATGPGQSILLLAVGRLDAPPLLGKILAHLESPIALVRQDALVALRKHRSPRTEELVRRALSDPESAVRVEALRYVSVYRDTDAAPQIMERLCSLKQGEAPLEEQRALGMAYALITREEGVLPLTRVVQDAGAARSDAATAAVLGLGALGESGRAALRGLARTKPELRSLIRAAGVVE